MIEFPVADRENTFYYAVIYIQRRVLTLATEHVDEMQILKLSFRSGIKKLHTIPNRNPSTQ